MSETEFDLIQQEKGTRKICERDLFCIQSTEGYHFGLVARSENVPDPGDKNGVIAYFYKGTYKSPDDYVNLDRSLSNIAYRPTFLSKSFWTQKYCFTVLRPDTEAEVLDQHIRAGNFIIRNEQGEQLPPGTRVDMFRGWPTLLGLVVRLKWEQGATTICDDLQPFGRTNRNATLEEQQMWNMRRIPRPGTEPGERLDYKLELQGSYDGPTNPGDMFVIKTTDGYHYGTVLAEPSDPRLKGHQIIRLYKGIFDSPDCANDVDVSDENVLFRAIRVNRDQAWWLGYFKPVEHNHDFRDLDNIAFRDLDNVTFSNDHVAFSDEDDIAQDVKIIPYASAVSVTNLRWVLQDQGQWAEKHWPRFFYKHYLPD